MATLITGAFAEYYLSAEERKSAQSLTDLQTFHLQNERSKIAGQLLGLTPDPNSYSAYIQQEAYLKGQLALIDYLLQLSTIARTENHESV